MATSAVEVLRSPAEAAIVADILNIQQAGIKKRCKEHNVPLTDLRVFDSNGAVLTVHSRRRLTLEQLGVYANTIEGIKLALDYVRDPRPK